MILKNFINDVVKSTIFLRNEFKKINNTLFLKIFNIGINENSIYNLLDKQNINAIFEKYSESLYFNFDTINTYIKNLVEKVTTELLQYIDKFRELKLTIPCDFNILQYRITNMSQLISFDLFNKYVFYQENDQNYLFSISEITKIMSSSKINPFTNQPFSQIFEKTFTQFFVKNNKNQENSKSHFVNSFNDSNIKDLIKNYSTKSQFKNKDIFKMIKELSFNINHNNSMKFNSEVCYYCNKSLGNINKWTKTVHKSGNDFVTKFYHISCLNSNDVEFKI